MLDQNISNHNINYHEIAQAVQQKREESPEFKNLSDREIISHVLQVHTGVQPQNNPVISAQTDNGQPSNVPGYASSADPQTKEKLEELINMTLENGISAGVNKVRGQDPYLIDLYHDALADKLYDEMKKRNLI